MKECFTEVILPISLMILFVCVVLGIPLYFVGKDDCSTFAELQGTGSKYTLAGNCYIKLGNDWITKDRFLFYKAVQ